MAISPQRKAELDAYIAAQKAKAAAPSGPSPEVGGDVLTPPTSTPTLLERAGSGLGKAVMGFGGLLQQGAEKVIKPTAQAVAKPFLDTAATAVASTRGAYNLATGNIQAEYEAQQREKQQGGVSLGPLGTYQPVRSALGAVGTGAQIATTLALPGVAKFGASMGAPAAATGLFTGGTAGLVHGAGTAMVEAGQKGKSALETLGDVTMRGTSEAAIGAATGYGIGRLTDWWTRKPTKIPSDEVKQKVIEKARAADAAAGPQKLGKPTTSVEKSVKTMTDSGLSPEDLDDLSKLSPDDLKAVRASAQQAEKALGAPSQASKYRANQPVAENLLKKIDKLEEINKPISIALRKSVADAKVPFDRTAFAAKITEALPDDVTAYSDADRGFIDKIIERAAEVDSPLKAHDFRKWIASESDIYKATMTGGKRTAGDVVAGNIRNKAGEYIDDLVPEYGALRRREQPILNAMDEFWSTMGGKWKNYEGEALTRRASEISRRMATNTSANTQRAVELLDNALAGEGANVGGDIGAQAYYANLVENMYKTAPPGALKGEVTQANLDALDIAQAATGPKGVVQAGIKYLTGGSSSPAARRALAVQQAESRAAFVRYIDFLLSGSDEAATALPKAPPRP